MPEPVILSACRTAIGKFMGALAPMTATQLGAGIVKEAVHRSGVEPERIEEVILGNVLSAGLGQNPARQAALHAGIPPRAGGLTINKVCGSGLKAVMLAAQSIRLGETEFAVAGGMESMSNAPYLLSKMRGGARMGNTEAIDSMIHDGLWCALENIHMGGAGETVARKYGITRQAQDEYAYHSHQKSVQAIKTCQFQAEVVPVSVAQPKGETKVIAKDEGPREDTSLETLAKLKPAFQEGGTVSAGNAPGVNDGAAALVLTSLEKAMELGLKPVACIVAQTFSGVEPAMVLMAPVPAFRKLMQITGWRTEEVDRIELNEAFAVQAIAVIRELNLDPLRVNTRGGAVALGHPIGASGARILVTLLHALRDSGGRKGVATLCMGGGNGLALAVELM